MIYTLGSHIDGYGLTTKEKLFCLIGFNAAPYALRHFSLAASNPSHKVAHYFVGTLELLPVIGAIAAIIEKIAHTFFGQFNIDFDVAGPKFPENVPKLTFRTDSPPLDPNSVSPKSLQGLGSSTDRSGATRSFTDSSSRSVSPSAELLASSRDSSEPPQDDYALKFLREKAESLRTGETPFFSTNFISPITHTAASYAEMRRNLEKTMIGFENGFLPPLDPPVIFPGVTLICTVGQTQGKRPTLEDAFFAREEETYFLAGVFDGHSGSEVARKAADFFQQRDYAGDIFEAFTLAAKDFQAEIAADPELDTAGTTAVICYLDKPSGLIYTMNIGDSAAVLYAGALHERRVTPLTAAHNWKNPEEQARGKEARGDRPEDTRVIERSAGLTVSRSLGLAICEKEGDPADKPIISHEPEITVASFEPDSTLILFSDGLSQVKREALEQVIFTAEPDRLAESLIALTTPEGRKPADNVTVVALKIKDTQN